MSQFLGNIEAKVDNKGRLFVPAAYRRSLEGSGESMLYMRVDTVNCCAKLYPASEWEKINEEIKSKLNLWDKKDARLYRQFTSTVEPIELDSNGRILLQKKHLEALEIETEALFVGVDGYFEIWNKENYEEDLMSDEEFSEAVQEKMGALMSL